MSFLSYLASGTGFMILLIALVALIIGSAALASKKGHATQSLQVAIGAFFLSIAVIVFVLSEDFPRPLFSGNEASIIPRLWASILLPSSLFLIYRTVVGHEDKPEINGRLDKVALIVLTLVVSVFLMDYFGYFLCSGLFVMIGMYILGYRKLLQMVIISSSWVGFTYLVFYRLLYVSLPLGSVIKGIFNI